ncbi:MAG: hypothetical protein QGH39_02990 [Candidatus Thermoplasmatota archaeon]|nr:hypothetical protein [Candidatus Thermoplasmatota archaeon]
MVRKNIEKIREQGETPRTDLSAFDSMDKYVCDLCRASVDRSGLIQCSFCGRWVCRNDCFDRDDVSCLNCHGVIRLLRESRKMDILSKKKAVLLDERKTALREEMMYQKKRGELEKKRKMDEIEFENKKLELERNKSLQDMEANIMPQDSGRGVLKAIRKIKKMKNSDNAGNNNG